MNPPLNRSSNDQPELANEVSDSQTNLPLRIAHFSDIHLLIPNHRCSLSDYLSKKGWGRINLHCLGRAYRFRFALPILQQLRKHMEKMAVNHIVFSGDAGTIGIPGECEAVANLLGIGKENRDNNATLIPGLAVPGNHDRYTWREEKSQEFEQAFSCWQKGERIDNHRYPFAQKVGNYWLIAVNSARPNPIPFDARGEIDSAQFDRLIQLCSQLNDGIRILVTHYPLRRPNGQLEGYFRRLRHLDQVMRVLPSLNISLWLHGHIHHSFFLDKHPDLPLITIGSGSVTQEYRWSYHHYLFHDQHMTMERYHYDPVISDFVLQETIPFRLPV